MSRFEDSAWSDIERLREALAGRHSPTVQEGAQSFVEDFAQTYASVVLARLFIVLPMGSLPPADQAFATAAAKGDRRLTAKTRVLSLLGTAGREQRWRDRALSEGHLAIPLLDRAHVENIPMLARLLGDLQVDFAALDDGRALASQPMLGGVNAKFLVPDAQTTRNNRGELVIPSQDFVTTHGVRTVFGMGGAYVDGTLTAAVIFSDQTIDPLIVNRFPSLIGSFKMATSARLAEGAVYSRRQ